MNVSRFKLDGADPAELAAELRALQPSVGSLADDVAAIIDEVAEGGDAAVLAIEGRFGTAPQSLRVPDEQLRGASDRLDDGVAEALRIAAANIRTVAEADPAEPTEVALEQGQTVALRDVPVGAAGAYAPGGAAAYPSTALMCCVPAKVAGVERIALASPPAEDGRIAASVLAACELGDADEVYAMGGAQAIAALALGTESVEAVDVIVGPGNRYVQEAKRQLFGRVGVDGIAGPSELMVILGPGADLAWAAMDLAAQGEHGADGLLVAAGAADALAEVESSLGATDAPLALVETGETEAAVELANALAPEHLQLAFHDAQEAAAKVRTAGCVFLGPAAGTAFGDYAAGSNHVLPTGGAGRFSGPLGPRAFSRRMANVTIPEEAAAELATPVATLADAEGFRLHGESARARNQGAD